MACSTSSLLAIFHFINIVVSFNLDTSIPIVKEGIDTSYFGFSVAQHVIGDEEAGIDERHVFLVGATKDNYTNSAIDTKIRQLKQPGVVYSCPFTSRRNDCDQLDILKDGIHRGDNYDDSWLGVSISSQAKMGGYAIACGHRYKLEVPDAIWGFGMCITLANSLDREEFQDVCSQRSVEAGHQEYGACQAGASVTTSKTGKPILIGSPGPYDWRGMVSKNIIQAGLEDLSTYYSSPVEDEHTAATRMYSYLGMSVAIGNVTNRNQYTYIGGAPRSLEFGQVLLFHQRNTVDSGEGLLSIAPNDYLTGEQFGAGFGYSLAVADLNNDTYQDLVVGAPFYFDENIGGKIYIYMNDGRGITRSTDPIGITSRKMARAECLRLDCENARFGFSLAALGDVDKDGYEDIAVGAPFEGNGVVYIFRGSKQGLMPEYSQRIPADDLLSARPLQTFGYSLSGGVDMDGSTYPDLVVGAYASSKTVVLRARPVVNIFAEMRSTPSVISPDLKRCVSDGEPYNCFELRLCFRFTAEPKDRFTGGIGLSFRLEADTLSHLSYKRVLFKGANLPDRHILKRNTVLNSQSNTNCKEVPITVYIVQNNKDFLTPIRFHLNYTLKDVPPPVMSIGGPVPDINTFPILNQKTSAKDYNVEFEKQCGADQICHSDLKIDAELQLDVGEDGDYVLKVGLDTVPSLRVRVSNLKEDAHQAMLYLTLPAALSYKGTDSLDQTQSCTPMNKTVSCPLGNPLKNNQLVDFIIRFIPKGIDASSDKKMELELRVNTTSEETDDANDYMNFRIKVVVETDMKISGHSDPPVVFYSGLVRGESAHKYEEDIGQEITHTFDVTNEGPGTVSNSTVYIHWPYEVENGYPQGKHLLYLLEEPEVQSPGRCMLEDWMVNPLGIKKRPKRPTRPVNPNNTETTEEPPRQEGQRSRRVKREYVVPAITIRDPVSGKSLRVVTLDCDSKTAKCFTFPCYIGELGELEGVAIKLRARLWNSTFIEDYKDVDEVRIYSKAEIKIADNLNVRQTDTVNDIFKVQTDALPDIKVVEPPGVQLWVIIVAVCAGVLLLLLLILLLWKCGFFRRKRAEDMAKHQANLEKKKHTKKINKKKNVNYYD